MQKKQKIYNFLHSEIKVLDRRFWEGAAFDGTDLEYLSPYLSYAFDYRDKKIPPVTVQDLLVVQASKIFSQAWPQLPGYQEAPTPHEFGKLRDEFTAFGKEMVRRQAMSNFRVLERFVTYGHANFSVPAILDILTRLKDGVRVEKKSFVDFARTLDAQVEFRSTKITAQETAYEADPAEAAAKAAAGTKYFELSLALIYYAPHTADRASYVSEFCANVAKNRDRVKPAYLSDAAFDQLVALQAQGGEITRFEPTTVETEATQKRLKDQGRAIVYNALQPPDEAARNVEHERREAEVLGQRIDKAAFQQAVSCTKQLAALVGYDIRPQLRGGASFNPPFFAP